MVFPNRRYLSAGLACMFVFILYQLQGYLYHDQTRPFSSSIYQPLQKPINAGWTWAERKPHFPVEKLTPLPSGRVKQLRRVQNKFRKESVAERSVRLERQQAVKATFVKGWRSYRERAWMKDELSPLTGGGRNTFGGWAATLVDSLDTLWIMGMKEEFKEAATAAMNIDFSVSTDQSINVFETTIRYLGGFLAAYDLSGDINLLHKAVEIGEMLLIPFDTPNHLPITRWDWTSAKRGDIRQEAPSAVIVSEIGSLSMEFTRLSQLTGDPRWYDAIDRITRLFDKQQQDTNLPGMWPVLVNPKDEDLTKETYFTLGGMSDSLYEYFPKMHALLGGLQPLYQKLYEGSMSTAVNYLFFRPMTPNEEDILIAGDLHAHGGGLVPQLEAKGQHLTCFVGGMLALGGRLFGNEEHLVLAKKITDGCVWAYNATSVGVMPEIALFVPCPQDSCSWDDKKWKAAVAERSGRYMLDQNVEQLIASKHLPPGFAQIADSRYILRPEALESVFYMYRITGDRNYLDHAWQMFSAIIRISESEFANAAVRDITVTASDGLPPKDDRTESFWFAETLKYAYLIFSEPDVISLDDYVFNTEAHPFKRPN